MEHPKIESLVYKSAIKNGMPVKLAELITAQSKHETKNYTSRVFKLNNNLFGYTWAGQKIARQGTPKPKSEGGFYAAYDVYEDSVKEIADWIKRRQKGKRFPQDLTLIKTPELYAGLLKNAGYYGAPLSVYLAGLKRYLKQIETLT